MKEMIRLAPASSFDTFHSFVVNDFVNLYFYSSKATNCIDSLKLINENCPDIVALSAQIENTSCFDFLNLPKHTLFQAIVFAENEILAHKAVTHDIADFVIKPYTAEKVAKALDIAIKKQKYLLAQNNTSVTPLNTIIYMVGGGKSIDIEDVMYIEAHIDFVKVYTTDNKSTIIWQRLKQLEKLYPGLIRCHKSYIVNIKYITDFFYKDMTVELNNLVHIPVGRIYKKLIFPNI